MKNVFKFLCCLMYLAAFGQAPDCFEHRPSYCHAESYEGEADNGTLICSPKANEIFEQGEKVNLWVCPGRGTKRIKLYVYHNSGFVSNAQDPLLSKELVYYKTFTGPCRVPINRELPNLCGRSGNFTIAIVVYSNIFEFGSDCGTENFIAYKSNFVIKPGLDIGRVVPQYESVFVCTGNDVVLSVDSTVDNQNNAIWYTESGVFLKKGYTLTTNVNSVDPRIYQVSYLKEYENWNRVSDEGNGTYYSNEDCAIEGVRMPYIALGLPVDALPSPLAQTKFLCGPDTAEIIVKNQHNYTGVRWYSDPGRTNLVHTGFSYKQFFKENEKFYIEYYKDFGSCEQVSAAPGVVVVYVANDDMTSYLTSNSLRGLDTEFIVDHRDFENQNCRDNPLFYTNLKKYDITGHSFSPSYLGAAAKANISAHWVSNYTINGRNVFLRDGESHDGYTADLYWNDNTGDKIVCSDHVGKPKGEYGTRIYTQRAEVDFTYDVMLEDGKTSSEHKTCPVPLRRVEVTTKGLNDSSGDEICLPISANTLLSLDPTIFDGCTRKNIRNICPDERPRIGPTEEEILAGYSGSLPKAVVLPATTYKWSPTSGLSASNVANPYLDYDGVPVSVHNYYRYTLLITYPDNSTLDYCEIVYKCRNCGEPTTHTTIGILD